METHNKKRGLLPKTESLYDLSRHKVLGSVVPGLLIKEDFLIVPPLEVMNQDINYDSDFCASYAATAASEAQDGITEVPEYTFAKAKQIIIQNLNRVSTDQEKTAIITNFGLELRDIMNAGIHYGFLEREHDPFQCDTSNRPAREYVADYRNWPADLDALAYEHAKNSYLSCDGPYDTFTNIRAALLQNRPFRQGIITGANWRASWSSAPGGVIHKDLYAQNEPGEGHAFCIIGQATTEKGLCLVAQLSDGPGFGDHGLFYFTADVVNAEFTPFGAYHFSNIPKATAQVHNDFDFTVDASAWQKFWKIATYWITSFKK